MRIFIALLLLASWRSARAAPQYEDGDSDDYDDWGFGSRGAITEAASLQRQGTTDTWRWGGGDGNSFEVGDHSYLPNGFDLIANVAGHPELRGDDNDGKHVDNLGGRRRVYLCRHSLH